uniref:Uncharacterized protein n=1 Tax=Piliocolobus tephrosceles TaxID=591936 RepID=A0A8C9IK04_9PRIM
VCRRQDQRYTGVLSFEMPRAIVFPPFFASFSFFHPLFQLQMPKKMPADTTLP